MEKVKVVKKLRKSKQKFETPVIKKSTIKPQNQYADKYLQFYDDIKIPSKRYDW